MIELPYLRSCLVVVLALLTGACQTAAWAPQIVVYDGVQDEPGFEMPPELKAQEGLLRGEWASFQREAERVHGLVQRDLAFGGLVLRWSPGPHAIVMFTGEAKARLAQYTADPRFHARRVELTLAELEHHKAVMTTELARYAIRCIVVDADEEHNRVTVKTPEVGRVRQLIAQRRIKAPPKLALATGVCAELRSVR